MFIVLSIDCDLINFVEVSIRVIILDVRLMY